MELRWHREASCSFLPFSTALKTQGKLPAFWRIESVRFELHGCGSVVCTILECNIRIDTKSFGLVCVTCGRDKSSEGYIHAYVYNYGFVLLSMHKRRESFAGRSLSVETPSLSENFVYYWANRQTNQVAGSMEPIRVRRWEDTKSDRLSFLFFRFLQQSLFQVQEVAPIFRSKSCVISWIQWYSLVYWTEEV